MHTAYSRRQAPKRTAKKATTDRAAMTTTDVRDRLAGLDAPTMPEHLSAKVTDAIAAESARRGFDTNSTRRRLLTSR